MLLEVGPGNVQIGMCLRELIACVGGDDSIEREAFTKEQDHDRAAVDAAAEAEDVVLGHVVPQNCRS